MASTLSFGIKLQMADIGKAITDSVKNMKPVSLPTAKMSPEAAATFQSISQEHTPNRKQQSTGDMLSEWINNPKNPLSKMGIGKTFDKYRMILSQQGKKIQTSFKGIMGELEERTKNSGGAIKDSWSRFNAELSDSSSMSDALGAFRGLGDGVVKSFTTMAKPIAGWILLAAGLTKQLTDAAKELEDSQNRLNQAFKGGGRMKGVSAEKYTGMYSFSEYQTMAGNIDRAGFMKSMANVRSTALSLDEKTFDKAMQQSIDLGAYLGVDKGEALEQYAEILNGLNFTYEDGIKLGTSFTRAEINMIDALKQAGSQAEANALIMKKVAEQTKGAQDEYMSTLSGKWEQFGNLIKSTLQDLGKILMPIMKLGLDIANLVLKVFKFITKIVSDFADLLYKTFGTALKKITGSDFGLGKFKEEISKSRDESADDSDPRLQLNTRFEGAESIVKNIQKGIMDQSPQAKMVNYLKEINGKLGEVHQNQQNQIEIAKATKQEIHDGNKIPQEGGFK